jgi:hypothetical protein
MSKRQESLLPGSSLNPASAASLSLMERWLSTHAAMISSLSAVTQRWYERRAGDLAVLQDAASRVAACKGPEEFFEAQSRCASTLSQRFSEDLTRLGTDFATLSGSALGSVADPYRIGGPPQKPAPKDGAA